MRIEKIYRSMALLMVLVLSAFGSFAGGGFTGLGIYVRVDGMRSPEMFGWAGMFIVYGVNALVAAAPALLTMCVCAAVRGTPLGVHALYSVLVSLVLGSMALGLFIITNPNDLALPSFLVAGATCLLVVIFLETAMRNRMQKTNTPSVARPSRP